MAEEQNFDYHPDKTVAAGKKPAGAVSWTASEYVDHQRGVGWYLGLLILSIGLAAGLYVLQKDIFASAVILLLGVIVAVTAAHKPSQASYNISPQGLQVGPKLYAYELFKSFSIIREGQLTSLIFIPLKRLQPPVSAYFDANDEEKITEIVGQYLPFEQRPPDRLDSLSRRLRF